jgi:6-phosphogluconolactonase
VVAASGSFTMALSGGRTPWLMCGELGRHEVPWEDLWIFQVDERIAPDGDPARNLTHLHESLPDAAVRRLVPMPITPGGDDVIAAEDALAYAGRLPPSLDLVHLGLGPDGHTASLVPGDPVLGVSNALTAPTGGSYEGHRRITLTYPALTAARRILWLVTGSEKRDPLVRLMIGDRRIPAGAVRAADATIVADAAAAAGIARP